MISGPRSNRPVSAWRVLVQAALFAAPFLAGGGEAHAASTTGAFTVSMPVNSPTCTVANGNPTLSLPTGASQTQTLGAYLSANGITTAALESGGWVTAASLNQTATITCTTASVPILSFVVEPASGASLSNGPGIVYLVDSAATPSKAAAGYLSMAYEQVSVNGTAAPQSYLNGSQTVINPNSTTFTTSPVANGTATVVWRPALYNGLGTAAMGTPTGGSYNSPGQIVVNY
jgi:hypothetical protein